MTIETIGEKLSYKIKNIFGQSLHIRHVDSGSSNGCESEMTALLNPVYDVQRYGIDFVASPRHADMLMVTGGVTRNLERSLKETYVVASQPNMIVEDGMCVINGYIFGLTFAINGTVSHI